MSQIEFRQAAVRLLRADLQPPQLTDAELLARFAATRDECAFAELVARHGALVRGTVRRCLRDPHTVEDVCQATFLVLAGKAATVQWGPTVGPWLHATAVRLARKALRRTHATGGAVPEGITSRANDPVTAVAWDEVCRTLDDELAALPDALRGPLVLCYLQGRTRDEAAHALGCSLAMLKRRLERGRNLLRDRLARRGISLPAAGFGLLACDLASTAATIDAVTRAAVTFATHGTAPPAIAVLLGASRGLQFKVATVVAIAVGLVACGAAFSAFSNPVAESADVPSDPPAVALASDEKPRASAPGDPLPPAALMRLGSTRLRAGGHVERMAFSPDGAKLASWSGDSHTNDSLTIWDAKSGRALRRIDLPGARVDQLVWLADGRGIALIRGSYDDPVPLIWEFTDEKAEKPQLAPRETKTGFAAVPANQPPKDNEHDSCCTINPDGKTVAIGRAGELDRDREVRLCELKTGVKVDALKPLRAAATHPGPCGELYFTPDAKTLVVFTRPKHLGNNKFEAEVLVSVWDVVTGDSKSQFKAPRPAANGNQSAVALSNTTLAIGSKDGSSSLWALPTGKGQKLATEHKGRWRLGVFSAAFTSDGKTLVTGGEDEAAKVWDVGTGKLLRTLAGNHTWVEVLSVAPGGKTLASAGQNGLIRLWDVATGADACPQAGHKDAVSGVAFGPDGKTAITGSWDNTLRWWDTTTGADRRSISVRGGVWGFSLSPDGKTVLVSTDDGKLRTWDTATGLESTPTNLPGDVKFGPLSFTPDGKYLVISSGPKVTIWEWPGMNLARTIELPKPKEIVPEDPKVRRESECQVASVSPDGKWLVTVSACHWLRGPERGDAASDGVVDLWDFATGKRIRRLVVSQGVYRSGGFTADGLFLLTGAGGTIQLADGRDGESFTGEINLIDPIAGRWVRGFDGPPVPKTVSFRYVGGSVFAPDGRTLYVSYNTGEIVAFEVATGHPRRTLTGHQGYVPVLTVSADGRRLLSGGRDGIAMVWDTTLAGAAPARTKPLTEADAEKLWDVAGRSDAGAAFTALCELAASPERAIDVLRKHVKPAPAAPSDAVLDLIFTDLGSEEFATRESGVKELAEYGELAVPGVRKRLEGKPTAEARSRALAFLKEFEKGTLSAPRLRQIRAVELLENMGTTAARKFLTEFATGAPGAPLTRDAAGALTRFGKP